MMKSFYILIIVLFLIPVYCQENLLGIILQNNLCKNFKLTKAEKYYFENDTSKISEFEKIIAEQFDSDYNLTVKSFLNERIESLCAIPQDSISFDTYFHFMPLLGFAQIFRNDTIYSLIDSSLLNYRNDFDSARTFEYTPVRRYANLLVWGYFLADKPGIKDRFIGQMIKLIMIVPKRKEILWLRDIRNIMNADNKLMLPQEFGRTQEDFLHDKIMMLLEYHGNSLKYENE